MLHYLYKLATDEYKGFLAGVIKIFLCILSLIYSLIVRLLIFAYHIKPRQLNCRVISVGNITLGGTGKTSLVLLIARYLKSQGHRIAILTRGYKKKVASHKSQVISSETIGDEPYMLSKNLEDIPIIVDKDRIRAANQAIKNYHADTVILDDGFQQWKIKKDLEIVAIDSTNPFGNRHLLPRGILREPLSSLKRADIFILTKANLNPDFQNIEDFLSRANPSAQIFTSIHNAIGFYRVGGGNEVLGADMFKGKKVTLFSGIGDPDSFEKLITSLGITVGLSFRFPDHHHYSREDLENIFQESKKANINIIVTTEKDATRLYQLPIIFRQAQDTSPKDTEQGRSANCALPADRQELPILFLRIELVITKHEPGFYNRLLQLYPH